MESNVTAQGNNPDLLGSLSPQAQQEVIYAELSGDFPLGDSRQPIYKSLRPFDLVS